MRKLSFLLCAGLMITYAHAADKEKASPLDCSRCAQDVSLCVNGCPLNNGVRNKRCVDDCSTLPCTSSCPKKDSPTSSSSPTAPGGTPSVPPAPKRKAPKGYPQEEKARDL